MLEPLKVMRKTFAAKSKIIRLEEKKAKARKRTELLQGLHRYRTHEVRKDSRTLHLANGFLRGTAYKRMERTCYTEPNLDDIRKVVQTFGRLNMHPDNLEIELVGWYQEGKVPSFLHVGGDETGIPDTEGHVFFYPAR